MDVHKQTPGRCDVPLDGVAGAARASGGVAVQAQHGLIDQSLHSRMGAETVNGDGFGVGWYGIGRDAGVYRSVEPAWGDANLRHLAAHIESPLFMAHVRATSGGAIEQSNCHPFQHERWLFVHNGLLAGFPLLRRDLMLAVEPELFPSIVGSTDSEVLFHLALTFGLQNDPIGALERAVGLVEQVATHHGVQNCGRRVSASVTESGCGPCATRPRAIPHAVPSASVRACTSRYPDNPRIGRLRDDDHVVVSSPSPTCPARGTSCPRRARWSYTARAPSRCRSSRAPRCPGPPGSRVAAPRWRMVGA